MRATLILCALLLGGCAAQIGPPTTTSPICDALIGPIHYYTGNKASDYYAGPLLAPQLKQRNQVGQALNCPEYRGQ